MAIEVISTIKPKNNGDFPIVEAQDVAVDDKGTRLNEKLENMAVNTPTFDLTELILPSDGSAVSLEMDTTEIRAALDKGVVEFKITLNLTESISIPVSVIPSVVEVNDTTYSCSAFYNFDANAQQGVINFMVSDTAVTVWITGLNNKGDTPTFDLTALGLADIQPGGAEVTLATDTTEIMSALDAGFAKFSLTMMGVPMTITPTTIKSINPEDPSQPLYLCTCVANFEGVLLVGNLMISPGVMVAYFSTVSAEAEEKPTVTDIDLSAFDSNGQIVETYSDGTTKTSTVVFDDKGNPSAIKDENGNIITELHW